MPTGLIIAIVVAAVVIIGLLMLLPRMRASARQKQAERELRSRRSAVAGEHRSVAQEGDERAELAERKARVAEHEAERERAEANVRRERASMHERGMADDELIETHERDRFDGVAGTADRDREPTSREGEGRFERERITDDVRESDRQQR